MGLWKFLFGNDKDRKNISQDIKFKVAARDGAKCRECGATQNLEIDHINPVSKSGIFNKGINDISNLQLLCRHCNAKKGAKQMGALYHLR